MARMLHCTNDIITVSTGDEDIGKIPALACNGKLHPSVIPNMGSGDYCKIIDEKPSGTNGGVFKSGAWRIRELNTIQHNDNNIASLNNNQITLPTGIYYFSGSTPATIINQHKCRLQNISDNETIAFGTSENCSSSLTQSGNDRIVTRSVINGKFTTSSSIILELQHQCGTSDTDTSSFGVPCSFPDVNEIYSVIEFWKIG